MSKKTALIADGQTLESACYQSSGTPIKTYDDGFGPLWISRDSMGVNGIVRAQTFETAYGICEDEFFGEADETIEELKKEYGFKREHVKVVRDASVTVATDKLSAGERFVTPEDYSDNGRLPNGMFIRWETIETPDSEAWSENELFTEAFGFRPNGPNASDTVKHGIYSKDLNGDRLELVTPALLADIGITLTITGDTDE